LLLRLFRLRINDHAKPSQTPLTPISTGHKKPFLAIFWRRRAPLLAKSAKEGNVNVFSGNQELIQSSPFYPFSITATASDMSLFQVESKDGEHC